MSTAENRVFWTDQRKQLVQALWHQGETATCIAITFGVSRMAVLGIVHRMGLPKRRPGGESQMQRKARRAKPNYAAKAKPKPVVAPEPYVFRETIVTAEHERISFEALEPFDKRCRYAHGDTLPFTFCGARTVPTTSYCLEHLKVCAPALAAKHQPADALSKELEPVA